MDLKKIPTLLCSLQYYNSQYMGKPKCSFKDKWIKKTYMFTMELYSFFEKKEILLLAKTQMKLEDIKLSEIRQTWKGKYMILLICEG